MTDPNAARLARARAWQAADPDPTHRDALAEWIAAEDHAALAAHMDGELSFGTAGIRGPMGPGPLRMNTLVVQRVAAAVGRVLAPGPGARRIVIGFDGRFGSAAFARAAAAVLGAQGVTVFLGSRPTPTPLLAHATTWLRAAAGIVVTASHNPKSDNGVKVYGPDGAQIVAPVDLEISAAIRALDCWPPVTPERAPLPIPPAAREAYLQAVLALRVAPAAGARAVYTAMHGVGAAALADVLAAAGHAPAIPVAAQCTPDGAFPTVAFPNPEEPGALDMALALARAERADLVLAHDPDADRLAVAAPDGSGRWRALTGNQLGVLLADELLSRGGQEPGRLVATTIVSTGLLSVIAQSHGARCVETLTGFKWIARAGMAHPGRFVMGFEEALGYAIGDVVRDKDGVSCALLVMDLASRCKAEGRTLWDAVVALYRRTGWSATIQRAQVLPGASGRARVRAILDGLRASPPAQIGGRPVIRIRDVAAGLATDAATGRATPLDLPRSDVLAWDLAGGGRVLVRPSGTEPKLKFYFEVTEPFPQGAAAEAVEAAANARIESLADAFLATLPA